MRNDLNGFFRSRFHSERGQVLLETVVTLPMIALLIGTALALLIFSVRFYRQNMADIELQSEIRLAMERIVEDASRSRSFSLEPVGSRLVLRRVHTGAVGSEDEVAYFLRDDVGTGAVRLCRNATNAPITGASRYGEVTITRFSCRRVGSRLRIELAGKSLVTKRTFSLNTEIFMGDG